MTDTAVYLFSAHLLYSLPLCVQRSPLVLPSLLQCTLGVCLSIRCVTYFSCSLCIMMSFMLTFVTKFYFRLNCLNVPSITSLYLVDFTMLSFSRINVHYSLHCSTSIADFSLQMFLFWLQTLFFSIPFVFLMFYSVKCSCCNITNITCFSYGNWHNLL